LVRGGLHLCSAAAKRDRTCHYCKESRTAFALPEALNSILLAFVPLWVWADDDTGSFSRVLSFEDKSLFSCASFASRRADCLIAKEVAGSAIAVATRQRLQQSQ
jgi:hypothetical protein